MKLLGSSALFEKFEQRIKNYKKLIVELDDRLINQKNKISIYTSTLEKINIILNKWQSIEHENCHCLEFIAELKNILNSEES